MVVSLCVVLTSCRAAALENRVSTITGADVSELGYKVYFRGSQTSYKSSHSTAAIKMC